jgi:hypothetical protein
MPVARLTRWAHRRLPRVFAPLKRQGALREAARGPPVDYRDNLHPNKQGVPFARRSGGNIQCRLTPQNLQTNVFTQSGSNCDENGRP